MRVNFKMPDELFQMVDLRAKELGITRTAFICLACSMLIQNQAKIFDVRLESDNSEKV